MAEDDPIKQPIEYPGANSGQQQVVKALTLLAGGGDVRG